MKRWAHCVVVLLVLVFLGASSLAIAAKVPARPSGYVNDYAHLLTTDQSQRISLFLQHFEEKTTDQVVVATFNSLGQDSLDDFSIHLADQWKIGTKAHDNGVILLIIKEGHHIRIEVGYGLEGVLTDALSGVIIRHDIAPYFKQRDYYQGIDHGVKAITQSIQGEYHATNSAGANASSFGRLKTVVPDTLIFLLLLYVVISIVGNAMVSLLHLLTPSRQTHANRWFGPHRFFCLSFYGFIVGILWSFLSSNTVRSHGGGGFSGGGGGFGGGGADGGW